MGIPLPLDLIKITPYECKNYRCKKKNFQNTLEKLQILFR